jgi:hypothetical protein
MANIPKKVVERFIKAVLLAGTQNQPPAGTQNQPPLGT